MAVAAAPTASSRHLSRLAKARTERLLLGAVAALVCLGIVMVYSVTSARAVIAGADPSGQVRRQFLYAVLGLVALRLAMRARPALLRRLGPPAVGVAAVLLVAVLIPSVGTTVNGSRRWLLLGPVQVQPSEIAKLALILWIAQAIARDPKRLTRRGGLIPFAALTGALALLIVIEPDLGTTVTIVAVAFGMLFVAGAPLKKLGAVAGSVAGLALLMVLASPYQRARVEAFLNPWADATGSGFQSVQAQIAIGSGGVFGSGLGNSIQKNNYLPEASTDMIAAIVGEELGLVGLAAIMLAFGFIGVAGYRIALRAKDLQQRLLATGITTLIVAQAAINLGAVLGLLPVTGVPLPFVSAGGSSLVVLLCSVGILVNIARAGRVATIRAADGARADASGDRGGGDGRARDAGAGGRRRAAGAGGGR